MDAVRYGNDRPLGQLAVPQNGFLIYSNSFENEKLFLIKLGDYEQFFV